MAAADQKVVPKNKKTVESVLRDCEQAAIALKLQTTAPLPIAGWSVTKAENIWNSAPASATENLHRPYTDYRVRYNGHDVFCYTIGTTDDRTGYQHRSCGCGSAFNDLLYDMIFGKFSGKVWKTVPTEDEFKAWVVSLGIPTEAA